MALQKQFSDLQEEQKRKLAMIRQRQSTKNTQKPNAAGESFGVADDLSLNVNDVLSSSTVGLNVSLEASNSSMRDEIRELRDETGRLRKVSAEKEYEIKKLNKKILKLDEEKRFLSEAGVASDSASSKIVELSKRNRELTAVAESEKSKSLRLQQKVVELENKLRNLPDGMEALSQKSGNFAESYESPRATINELQEQLNSSNLKVADYRNQVQSLKQEIKVANKVLSQETGEPTANIQLLLSNSGQGFRGRAQQVSALQTKVKDLEAKLRNNSSPREDRNSTRIKNMERARKEQNETLKEDIVRLQEQSSDYQRKWEASKARSKILTGEVKSLKSQIALLNDKGRHDNELITTLTRQQDNLQKLLERSSRDQHESTSKEIKIHQQDLHNRQQQESSQVSKLKDLLAESQSRVKQLEEDLEQVSLVTPNSSKDTNAESHKPLSVFSQPPQGKLHQAAQTTTTTPVASMTISTDGKRIAELEALYKASELEREKLTELIAILNKRLQSAISKAEDSISALHDEKRRTASLEQSLESRNNNSGGFESNREALSSSSVDNLKAQLAIQKDENNALKEVLESTLRAKQDDISTFNEISEQTKSVFLDALRSFGSASK